MQSLLEETQRNIVDLVRAWREGDTARRQELAFSLYPEGLRYSRETKYFEPHNTLLMNAMREMLDGIADGSLVGVPDGTRLFRLLAFRGAVYQRGRELAAQ